MKVTFQYGIGSFSGTVENAVFWPTLNKLGSYMRKYVVPKLTENNTLRGTIMKNLSEVWSEVSSGYKLEMKTYCERLTVALNDQQDPFAPRYTSFGIWVKMMYLFSKLDAGHINLESITYSDLQTVGDDILSIAVAVENEYMTAVPGYDELITNMQVLMDMNKELPQDLLDEIAEKINEVINIPFMSESQEKLLFVFLLRLITEKLQLKLK